MRLNLKFLTLIFLIFKEIINHKFSNKKFLIKHKKSILSKENILEGKIFFKRKKKDNKEILNMLLKDLYHGFSK